MRGLPLEEKPPTLGQFCLPIPPPANVLRNLPLELPSQATAEAPVDKKTGETVNAHCGFRPLGLWVTGYAALGTSNKALNYTS